MNELFSFDNKTLGTKGLVFIGEKILVYRRDTNTNSHPLQIDLPGGGQIGNETPFQTFQREVMEEFGLRISKEDITYSHRYPSMTKAGMSSYFPVAKLPSDAEAKIEFGNEGLEYMLISVEEYIARDDAWAIFKERTIDYLNSIKR